MKDLFRSLWRKSDYRAFVPSLVVEITSNCPFLSSEPPVRKKS